jgi:hypothetical protein
MHHRFRKLAGALAAVALAVGLAMAGTGTARADVVPATSWAEIFNPNLQATQNNLCADDPNASTAEFQALQLWHCHASASNGISQRWTFQPQGSSNDLGPLYRMANVGGSNYCISLDVHVAFVLPYAQWSDKSLVQESCDDTVLVDWNVVPATHSPDPAHQVEIVSTEHLASDQPYCLAADNFRDLNGTRLVVLPCSPDDSRQWWLI